MGKTRSGKTFLQTLSPLNTNAARDAGFPNLNLLRGAAAPNEVGHAMPPAPTREGPR